MDKQEFKNPDSYYRTAPFWSWNDKLEPEELVRQIRLFKEQGIGGFFMHPRGGMVDHYMGQSFMNAVKACVQEADRLDMKAWLYDEDRWPSGFAGGRAVQGRNELRGKFLEMIEIDAEDLAGDTHWLKVFVRKGDVLADVTQSIPRQGSVLAFRVGYCDPDPRFNYQSYPDLCCKEAVEAFIEVTHEIYRQEVGESFGGVVPGIFTDEPHFDVSRQGQHVLTWSQNFRDEFRRRKGYDILDHLPKLFLATGDYRKLRFDYWDVLSRMFITGFTETIYRWCDESNLEFTGHFWDHTFPSPARTGSTMPHYEFMHAPGIDLLFNTAEERDQYGNDLIVKEVSSVANQLGKHRVLSETYGGSGWDLNFVDQKRVADWQLALGINLFSQHLSLYSLRGYRKRDFPLSFLDHQPWWDSYRLLGDYIGRLSYALAQGDPCADILVLHPSSSTWAEYNPAGDDEALAKIEDSAKRLTKSLSQLQCFFDLGDDIILERHGQVTDAGLMVGNMTYSTVIIPTVTTLRRSTFLLLQKFAANGGRIAAVGDLPSLLDGEESSALAEFMSSSQVKRIAPDKVSLQQQLKEWPVAAVMLKEKTGKDLSAIYAHRRTLDSKQIVFLCSVDKKESYDVSFQLAGPYYVECFDPITGDTETLQTYEQEGTYYIDLVFHPVGSHLLVIDPVRKAEAADRLQQPASPSSELTLGEWQITRQDPNALTINCCSVSLNGGEWEDPDNVVSIDDSLKDRLGIERGHIFSRQPWMYSPEEGESRASVKARYTFRVNRELTGSVMLAAESPDVFAVSVNDIPVQPTGSFYKDRAFVLYDIKEAVGSGDNHVVLETDQYGVLVTLESVYIVGDFALTRDGNSFSLVPEPASLPLGDWTTQGYPYYSGRMCYTASFDIPADGGPVFLKLADIQAVAARIYVNGGEMGVVGWPPYRLDVSEACAPGRNEVTIEVMNSLQNLLGPHSYQETEGIITPASFYSRQAVRFEPSGFGGHAVIQIG